MWPVEHTSFAEQPYQDPRAFSFLDLATQLNEQGFNVRPTNVCGCRARKHQLEGPAVLAFHELMVAKNGITIERIAREGCDTMQIGQARCT
jgi:hypothetical protein